jgi:catechol 2,3-dioxygenase-like lactoylglutathione lyase family enzyme
MNLEALGYISAFLGIIAVIPYIRGIIRGNTRPERLSWLIWVLLDVILVFSQLAKGGSYSVLMTVGFLVADLAIFLLSLKYGYRNKLLKRDYIALAGVGLGLLLWYVSKEAAIAIFAAIIIDAMGGVLTIIKSYESPKTENLTKWVLTALSALLACFAVGSFNIYLLAFPVFILCQSLAIIIAIQLGKRRKKTSTLTPELKVSNIKSSLEFYTDIAGFKILYDRPEHGFAMLGINGARLMLEELNDKSRTFKVGDLERPFGRGMHFQIEVKDVDTLYQNFRRSGHPLFLEMEEKWYRVDDKETGNRQFLVQDPDGYLLRFFEDMGTR